MSLMDQYRAEAEREAEQARQAQAAATARQDAPVTATQQPQAEESYWTRLWSKIVYGLRELKLYLPDYAQLERLPPSLTATQRDIHKLEYDRKYGTCVNRLLSTAALIGIISFVLAGLGPVGWGFLVALLLINTIHSIYDATKEEQIETLNRQVHRDDLYRFGRLRRDATHGNAQPSRMAEVARRTEENSATKELQEQLTPDQIRVYAAAAYPADFYGQVYNAATDSWQQGTDIMVEPMFVIGANVWCDKSEWDQLPPEYKARHPVITDFNLKSLIADYAKERGDNAGFTFADYVRLKAANEFAEDTIACSIMMELMQTPTLNTASGRSYEKEALLGSLETRQSDPITRVTTTEANLRANAPLTKIIAFYNAVEATLPAPVPVAERDPAAVPVPNVGSSAVAAPINHLQLAMQQRTAVATATTSNDDQEGASVPQRALHHISASF